MGKAFPPPSQPELSDNWGRKQRFRSWFGARGISVVSEAQVKPQARGNSSALPFPRLQQHLEVWNSFCGLLKFHTDGCRGILINNNPSIFIHKP